MVTKQVSDMKLTDDIAFDENTIFFECRGCGGMAMYYPTAVGKVMAGCVAHTKPPENLGIPNSTGCQLFTNSTARNYWRSHKSAQRWPNPKKAEKKEEPELLSSMSEEDRGKLIGFLHVMHKDMTEGGVHAFSFGMHRQYGVRIAVLYDEGEVKAAGATVSEAVKNMSEQLIKEGMKGAAEA